MDGDSKSGESDSEAIQRISNDYFGFALLENIPYTALQIQKIIARQKATNDKKQSLIIGYDTVLRALYTHPHNYPLLGNTIVTIHAALFPNGKMHSNDEPARLTQRRQFPRLTKRLPYSAVTKRYRSITKYGIWSNGPTTN